jgi:hypothetical protein
MGGNCASRAEREVDQDLGGGVYFSNFSAGFFGFLVGVLVCRGNQYRRALGRTAVSHVVR